MMSLQSRFLQVRPRCCGIQICLRCLGTQHLIFSALNLGLPPCFDQDVLEDGNVNPGDRVRESIRYEALAKLAEGTVGQMDNGSTS